MTIWSEQEALAQTMGRQDMLTLVVEAFLEDAAKLKLELEKAAEQNDWANIRFYAHTLKGSCANIAASELSEHAKKLQFAIDQEDHNLAFSLLETLPLLHNALVDCLQAYLVRQKQAVDGK